MPTLAVCAIVRDEETYVEEWLAHHALNGVSRFRIYDNSSQDQTLAKIEPLRASLNIEVIPWPQETRDFGSHQKAAHTDGARALAGKVDFVAFIDVDEFLWAKGRSLPEALAAYGPDVGAIGIQQRTFGSSGEKQRKPGYVTARFTRTGPANHGERYWIKTIARPECVDVVDGAHSVKLASGRYVYTDGRDLTRSHNHGGRSDEIVEGPICLNHYILKSLEEFKAKQRKWHEFQPAMADRYDDGYFLHRDATINSDVEDTLAKRADQIAAFLASTQRV